MLVKEGQFFTGLKEYNGITLLQETHSTSVTENIWAREWEGSIYFSHGTQYARGVAVLIPGNLDVQASNILHDEEGRFLLLEITFDGQELIIANFYAPTKDKSIEQLAFLDQFKEKIDSFFRKKLVVGGRFQCMPQSKIR